jgi:alpha-L-rhamnosidase
VRGETQSGYEIQVGSTSGGADLWDSGKVAGSQSVDVLYGGQALTSAEKCYWQVRVYDESNNVSAWSAPANWSMGLLSPTNWMAQWIGYDAAYDLTPAQSTNNALFNTSGLGWISYSGQTTQGGVYESALRKQVILPAGQTITNAVMALYADNYCNVYVNGQEMTNSAMNGCHPGAAAARWEATAWINVTPWLRAGTNELALDATSSDAQETATVIGQMVVQYASGSVSNIPVDTTWKAATWPSGNWTQTNYNDSGWAVPGSGGTPWGTPAVNDLARVPAPYMRKDFTVNNTVTRATVYVTALGVYELHLNGQKVGNDVLTPGWTQFTKRVYYQTYDVTSLVQNGSNTISAILGDGWYASDLAFKGSRLNYGGTPRFLAQLVLQLSDGSTQTVVSDGSWKASYGPIQWGDLLMGSEYDARHELPGWDSTNFNDSAWSPVMTGLSATTGGYTNVTTLVTSLESNNQLNFLANNTTMGGDPAFGVVKSFQITFTLGGTNQTLTYGENATIQIGNGVQPLTVIQALYGNAAAFPGLGGMLVQAAVSEPSRCLETLPATNLTVPSPGCYTFDLGQNMVGWAQLNISGKAGDRITVRHGEMLNPDGTVYTANLRGATATDYYIFATNGAVTFQPRFTFHGFRYVEVRGLSVPPTINSVTGMVVHSDIFRTGTFTCSDPLVNQLYSNIIWGQKGNYLEVPTDCPQRDERMGWTGDTEFFVPTAAFNFDVQSFFRRHMVTFCEDAQQPNGSYAVVVPDLGAGDGGTGWGDAGWICPYNIYRAYGDTNIIADHYASFMRDGQFDAANASNYVISSLPGDFGDWLNLGGGASSTVMDTAFYAYYAQAMSEMALAIGDSADAATYSSLHSNIVAAFATFFNPDGSFTDGSSQTGYALAFTLNLVPANLRAQAAQQFATSIANFGNHLATGFIGTPRLLPALHIAGRDDLAYTLLLQQTYPSWLYQVTLGSTTMWERWDGWTPGAGFESVTMNSFNHYAFGSVGQYLYSVVGGINPASPGYQTILIQPVPGLGLTWANTSYDSTRGLISTAWTNTGSAFNVAVVIPPNTTAQIYVPTTNAAAITESGVPAASSPGVTYVGISNSAAIYAVGSGSYLFSSPYSISVPPGVIITTTNQIGTGTNTSFTPGWIAVTNGSLIAGQPPATTAGNFSEEVPGRNVDSLTAGGSLTLSQIAGTSGYTTSTNYVTCGNGSGAGSQLTYTLTGSTTGYDLTNITVCGGWDDNGRDQQAYTVYYSTVSSPANFIQLAIVNFTPSVPDVTPSATRVTLTGSAGVLATNVAAVMFDFTSPASENGYCGYAAISVFGTPSAGLTATTIITTTNQTGGGSGTFYPGWTVVTNGCLIAGQSPSAAVGNFSEEVSGRNVNSLTAGGSLGIGTTVATSASDAGNLTTSTNYVTCGNGTGPDGTRAGSTIIYTLPVASNGYNLTNVTVYGGWADNGRDQQAYTVYYSTVPAPSNFLPLAVVNFNPVIANGIQSATRVTLADSAGVLATNVVAVKFDFTSPASENGYCGYAAITVFGTPSIAPALPAGLSANILTPNSLVMNAGGLVAGRNYIIQSTTNLTSGAWSAETNFVAASTNFAFTNGTTNSMKFYRVVGY